MSYLSEDTAFARRPSDGKSSYIPRAIDPIPVAEAYLLGRGRPGAQIAQRADGLLRSALAEIERPPYNQQPRKVLCVGRRYRKFFRAGR